MRDKRHKERILGKEVAVPKPYEVTLPDLEAISAFGQANFRHKIRARERCDALLATQPEKLRERVLKHRQTYVSHPVVDELLARVRKAVFTDARHAKEMAEIALFLADEMVPGPAHLGTAAMCRETKARCHAYLGNCHRVLCQWDEAERELKRAEELLWNGIGDPHVHGELLRFKGSFLREQRRFDEALEALREAAEIYQMLDERHMEGLVLLKVAMTLRQDAKPEEALPVHIRACHLVDEYAEPVAAAAAWNELMRIYLDQGRYEEANSVLHGASSVYDRCPEDSSVHVVRSWTEGCVLAGLGEAEEALRQFQIARSGFEAHQRFLDLALVQLDVVRVLLAGRRYEEIVEAVSMLSSALSTEPLKWDAKYALQLLEEAVEQRRLEDSVIVQAASAIQKQLRIPRSTSRRIATIAGAWDTFPEG